MHEVITMRPVVEFRERFLPNQPLRELIADRLFSPDLDPEERRVLQERMLFQTLRRRVMDIDTYAATEHDHNGSYRRASAAFDQLSGQPIAVMEGVLQRGGKRAAVDRLVLRLEGSSVAARAAQLLSSIPTIEPAAEAFPYGSAQAITLTLAKRHLHEGLTLNVRATELRRTLGAAAERSLLYRVRPERLTVRNTIIRQQDVELASREEV